MMLKESTNHAPARAAIVLLTSTRVIRVVLVFVFKKKSWPCSIIAVV